MVIAEGDGPSLRLMERWLSQEGIAVQSIDCRDALLASVSQGDGEIYFIESSLLQYCIDALEKLDVQPSDRQAPLLIELTASAYRSDDDEQSPWVSDVLLKPYSREEILRILERHEIVELANDLPTERAQAPSQTSAGKPAEPATSKIAQCGTLTAGFHRALIADDVPANRMLLRKLLSDRVSDIDEACDGVEALNKLGARMPDILFLDLEMPVLDGFGVLDSLRENDQLLNGAKIIAVSANDDEQLNKRLLAQGCDAVCSKPVSRAKLDHVLSELSGKH